MKDKSCLYYFSCKAESCEDCENYEPIIDEEEFHRCEDYKIG